MIQHSMPFCVLIFHSIFHSKANQHFFFKLLAFGKQGSHQKLSNFSWGRRDGSGCCHCSWLKPTCLEVMSAHCFYFFVLFMLGRDRVPQRHVHREEEVHSCRRQWPQPGLHHCPRDGPQVSHTSLIPLHPSVWSSSHLLSLLLGGKERAKMF